MALKAYAVASRRGRPIRSPRRPNASEPGRLSNPARPIVSEAVMSDIPRSLT